jgi:DNA invertase Pin-like site-specific DNA recombinase
MDVVSQAFERLVAKSGLPKIRFHDLRHTEMVVGDIRRVVGYIRVSTAEQGKSGLGLDAQKAAIEAECQHRGWELVKVYRDVASGKTVNGRHELQRALDDLGARRADALVAAKYDRLTRSVVGFGRILKLAKRHGWPLVVLELGLDTTTPVGEMLANILAAVAQFESRRIGERTKDAMQIARDNGATFGRAKAIDSRTEQRIVRLRKRGQSFQAIAEQLNGDGNVASQGGPWKWQTISSVARRHIDEPVRRRVRAARLD